MGVVIRSGLIQRCQAVFDQSSGAIHQAFEHVGCDSHVGDLLLDQAEGGDGAAELLSLLGIGDDLGHGRFHRSQAPGAELEAADIENVKGNAMASSHLPQDIFHRHRHIVQDQWTGGGTDDPHLVLFLSDRQARRLAFDHKGGEKRFIDLGKNGVQIRKRSIGNKVLGAVEDIVRTVRRQLGGGQGCERIRARLRFGEAITAELFTRSELWQVTLPQLRRA